jgi:hypothetical protein
MTLSRAWSFWTEDEIKGQVDEGDQVKVIMELTREEYPDWPNTKKAIAEECGRLGVQVFGIEMLVERRKERKRLKGRTAAALQRPEDTLKDFCNAENLSGRVRKEGERLLEEV